MYNVSVTYLEFVYGRLPFIYYIYVYKCYKIIFYKEIIIHINGGGGGVNSPRLNAIDMYIKYILENKVICTMYILCYIYIYMLILLLKYIILQHILILYR